WELLSGAPAASNTASTSACCACGSPSPPWPSGKDPRQTGVVPGAQELRRRGDRRIVLGEERLDALPQHQPTRTVVDRTLVTPMASVSVSCGSRLPEPRSTRTGNRPCLSAVT